jgi:hypothetical protein
MLRLSYGLIIFVATGVLFPGCKAQPPSTRDAKSVQQHADELKKQHQHEMQNRDPTSVSK